MDHAMRGSLCRLRLLIKQACLDLSTKHNFHFSLIKPGVLGLVVSRSADLTAHLLFLHSTQHSMRSLHAAHARLAIEAVLASYAAQHNHTDVRCQSVSGQSPRLRLAGRACWLASHSRHLHVATRFHFLGVQRWHVQRQWSVCKIAGMIKRLPVNCVSA